MPQPYDASSKDLVEARPADWLALAGLPVPPWPGALTVVDADLSMVTTAADKLVRVQAAPHTFLAHLEFQSAADPSFDLRMLVYNALARRRHRLPVRSVVFVLRPEAARGVSGGVVDHDDCEMRLDFSYRVVRVWQLPVDRLLDGPLGTLALAPLSSVRRRHLPAIFERIDQRLATETTPADAKQIWTSMRILSGLRYGPQLLETLMQGVTEMRDSWVWQQIHGEGQVEGRAAQLIELGTDKFGPPSPGVADRIAATTDVESLRRLARRLLTAGSWTELLAIE